MTCLAAPGPENQTRGEHRALFFFLKKWLNRQDKARTKSQFLLITRAHCHLCDDAWELLSVYQKKHDFTLETLDVDSTPELVAKYGTCVPVVLVDGLVRFRGRVNPVLLRRLLEHKG